MKPRQLIITAILKGYCFAETKYGKKEKIFVPFHKTGVVEKTSGGNPKLVESKQSPRYFLQKGDVIVAIVADGNDKRRQAVVWTPQSVWEGGEHTICKSKVTESKTKPKVKAKQPQMQKVNTKKENNPVEEFNFLKEVDLPFLDKYRNSNITIRVRPPSGRGQIYFGPLGTLFSQKAKAHILARVNNKDNVFEAEIEGEWQQIWPPVTTAKRAKIIA